MNNTNRKSLGAEESMIKKVVVFGGSGFLGSYVVDALTDRGNKVLIFDRKKSLYLCAKQEVIIGDILDTELVDNAVKGADYVYNFSGIADIGEAAERPVEAVKYNILGNTIILDACIKNNVKRFLCASTVYVYSNYGSFYKATKQSVEAIIEAYHEKYGLEYTILRYGSLYGPRAQKWNGIFGFVYQAITEGEIKYDGKGDEKREYIHVIDAAKLSVEVLKPEFANERVIITGTQSLTSKELLTTIKEMIGKGIKVKFTNNNSVKHYTITPYNFSPKLGKKLTSNTFIDFGQGLLQVIEEVYNKYQLGANGKGKKT